MRVYFVVYVSRGCDLVYMLSRPVVIEIVCNVCHLGKYKGGVVKIWKNYRYYSVDKGL